MLSWDKIKFVKKDKTWEVNIVNNKDEIWLGKFILVVSLGERVRIKINFIFVEDNLLIYVICMLWYIIINLVLI